MEAAEPIAAPGTARWRERARDPVLTALALLLAVVSFVTTFTITSAGIPFVAVDAPSGPQVYPFRTAKV